MWKFGKERNIEGIKKRNTNSIAGVLGHSFGAFTDGMLSKFTRQVKSHGCLDLARAEGLLFVVAHELSSLPSNLFKDVVNEGVHDRHRPF